MSNGLIDLISILDLEPIEVNMFRGNSPKTSWQRVFGGQVIGQAMVAACRTVEGRLPHSLHCYFILPGDPQIPIIYQVERLRPSGENARRAAAGKAHGGGGGEAADVPRDAGVHPPLLRIRSADRAAPG